MNSWEHSVFFALYHFKYLAIYKFNFIDSFGENGVDSSTGRETLIVVNTIPTKQITIVSIPDILCHLIIEG